MIILDSCALFEILWNGKSAHALAKYIDDQQLNKNKIEIPRIILLESANVLAVRYKEKVLKGNFETDLKKLLLLDTESFNKTLEIPIIEKAASIKNRYAASMVDCYILSLATQTSANILTSDPEILNFNKSNQSKTKITDNFYLVGWN